MAGDIYDLVNKATQSESKMSKVQLGYTVDTYQGVLAELQKLQAAAIASGGVSGSGEIGAGGLQSTRNPVYARWTMMDVINVSRAVSADGFIINGDGNGDKTVHKQRYCVLKPYMSFVVNLKNEKNEEFSYFAGFDSHNDVLNGGVSAASNGKLTYPLTNMTTETCNTITTALGGNAKNPFEIGIATDLTKNADVFFKGCYPNVYKEGMSAKLVAKRALLAEVAFVEGTSAKTLHARVIADVKSPLGLGVIEAIYFPIPLMLLKDYQGLGIVTVTDGVVKQVGVDEGCKFPFVDSKFDHLKCSIDDFNPDFLHNILLKNRVVSGTSATFATSKWQDNQMNSHDICYVRFYLDKEKRTEIQEILGDIPQEYQAEIFKGTKDAQMGQKVVSWEDSAYYDVTSSDVSEFWKNVGMQLVNQVDGNKLMAAIDFIGDKESKSEGGWAAWGICGDGNGDGEGVSAGKFQFTQRAGGIKIWLQKFLQRNGKISAGFQNAIQTSLTGNTKGKYAKLTSSEAQPLLNYKSEWQSISATSEGQLAQCDTWLQEKGHKTIKWFNILNCKSAAEFGAIFGGINHMPAVTDLYEKYKNDLAQIGSSYERAVFIENMHWAIVNQKGQGKGAVHPNRVNEQFVRNMSENYGKGWGNRYRDSIKKWSELS